MSTPKHDISTGPAGGFKESDSRSARVQSKVVKTQVSIVARGASSVDGMSKGAKVGVSRVPEIKVKKLRFAQGEDNGTPTVVRLGTTIEQPDESKSEGERELNIVATEAKEPGELEATISQVKESESSPVQGDSGIISKDDQQLKLAPKPEEPQSIIKEKPTATPEAEIAQVQAEAPAKRERKDRGGRQRREKAAYFQEQQVNNNMPSFHGWQHDRRQHQLPDIDRRVRASLPRNGPPRRYGRDPRDYPTFTNPKEEARALERQQPQDGGGKANEDEEGSSQLSIVPSEESSDAHNREVEYSARVDLTVDEELTKLITDALLGCKISESKEQSGEDQQNQPVKRTESNAHNQPGDQTISSTERSGSEISNITGMTGERVITHKLEHARLPELTATSEQQPMKMMEQRIGESYVVTQAIPWPVRVDTAEPYGRLRELYEAQEQFINAINSHLGLYPIPVTQNWAARGRMGRRNREDWPPEIHQRMVAIEPLWREYIKEEQAYRMWYINNMEEETKAYWLGVVNNCNEHFHDAVRAFVWRAERSHQRGLIFMNASSHEEATRKVMEVHLVEQMLQDAIGIMPTMISEAERKVRTPERFDDNLRPAIDALSLITRMAPQGMMLRHMVANYQSNVADMGAAPSATTMCFMVNDSTSFANTEPGRLNEPQVPMEIASSTGMSGSQQPQSSTGTGATRTASSESQQVQKELMDTGTGSRATIHKPVEKQPEATICPEKVLEQADADITFLSMHTDVKFYEQQQPIIRNFLSVALI